MIRPSFLSETLLQRLNAGVIGAGALVALAAAGLGVSLLMANGAASLARSDRTTALEREKAAEGMILRGAKVPVRKFSPRADQQIEAFGSTLAEACRSEGVTFTTFDNTGEAGPFTSRYGGTTDGKDWKASEARVTIRGELADIYTVLGKLKGHPVPFEVVAGSLEGGSGDREVRVGLTIAAIVREEKAVKEERVAGRG